MAQTKYVYSIAGDTANGKVDGSKLKSEIVESAITIAPDYINTDGDVLDVYMKDEMPDHSGGASASLAAVVAAHDGELEDVPQAVALYHASGGALPETSDGKPIFLPNLFRGDVELQYPGAGDHATNGRGEGTAFCLSNSTDSSTSTLEWQFNDWVYAAGGGLIHKGAEMGDWCSFDMRAAATTVTVNGTSEGNCNLTNLGGYNLITPASGDGTHDVAEADKVPVPSSDMTGYWDWNCTDTGKGTIDPSATPGAAKYNLIDAATLLVRWVSKVHLLGDGSLDMIVGAVKPKKILPHWTFHVDLHNGGTNSHTVEIVWHLLTARKKTW